MANILKSRHGTEALRTSEREPEHKGARKVQSRFSQSILSSLAGTKGGHDEDKERR